MDIFLAILDYRIDQFEWGTDLSWVGNGILGTTRATVYMNEICMAKATSMSERYGWRQALKMTVV